MKIKHAHLLAVIAAMGLGSVPAGAQDPPDRPERPERSQQSPGDRGGDGRERGGPEWRREYRGMRPWEEITDEKWAAVERFMKAHSPERLRRLDEVPEDRREMVRRSIVRRFDSLQQTQEREPEMYDLRVERMRLEDEIFTMALKLKEVVKPDAVEKTRKELRTKVKALLENRLSERRLRLQQAERRLEEERKGLQREEAELAEIVEKRVTGLLEEDRWPGLGELIDRPGMPPPEDRARRFRDAPGERRDRAPGSPGDAAE